MTSTKVSTSNQVLNEIINNSWSGIGIIDPTSKFIYVNHAFKPILGFEEEELLEMKFVDLLSQKDRIKFQELIIKNFDNEYTNSIRVECLRKDEKLVYLDISIKLISNKEHIVINANDITQNVSEHEIFDKYVIQAHIDTDGVITKVSEAFCRLSLFSSAELLGKKYSLLLHPSLNNDTLDQDICDAIQNSSQYNGAIAAVNKYGDIFWVDIIIKPIKNKYGDVTGYSAVMFDMTNEVSLQKNTEVLEETIGENEVKLKIMGDTLRTVAHQWRQPLNNISLEAQDLLFTYQFSDDDVKKDEAVPILESMRDNIEGLSNIIGKFQLITELKSDKLDSNMFEISKNAIFKSKAPKESITGNYNDEIIFQTYPRELETSIIAILDNAFESVSKLPQDEEKQISYNTYLSSNKKNLYIEVTNNGGNIEHDILDKIFDAYFSTKEEKNGVGLSLYISKIIVELHLNGKIEVKNKENNVVTFTINLPIGIEK